MTDINYFYKTNTEINKTIEYLKFAQTLPINANWDLIMKKKHERIMKNNLMICMTL